MSRFTRFVSQLGRLLLDGAVVAAAMIGSVHAAEKKGDSMSYGEARDLLAKYTKVVELADDAGARVAITPDWQGRVMTSTCGGNDGPSFGFINYDYVKEGKIDLHMNNYGAENRLWFCPEGGQYSLWFKPGAEQLMKNWFTPPAFNEGGWKVVTEPKAGHQHVKMSVHMKFQNTSSTWFDIDVTREVKLLSSSHFKHLFGHAAGKLVGKQGVKMVAYETDDKFTNTGDNFSKDKGLISMWILGMMNAGPKAVIIAPYKPGPESELGPVVKSDYFGAVPADRLKITPEAVLFRADNNYRSKIGISQRRVKNVLGSIDFGSGVLTLVNFTMPEDPTKSDYINNMWGVPQAKPYVGDVANAYNDGPNDLGKRMGAFYEIESISPAKELKTGESLSHSHRTIHIQADPETLHKLAKDVLGVDLDAVKKEMAIQ
jgi:hypothetical protein